MTEPNTTKAKPKAKPKKRTTFDVADVTELQLRGFHWDSFKTLEEAMAHVGRELAADADRFEIRLPTGETGQIDFRYCFDDEDDA